MIDAVGKQENELPNGFDGGNYNQPPPEMRELTEEEFAKSDFFVYGPTHIEFRQVYMKPEDRGTMKMLSIRMYWMPFGHGYAVHADYWKGTVTWFRFGCAHEYKELSQDACRERGIKHYGMHWHVTECSKCGNVHAYDSSG